MNFQVGDKVRVVKRVEEEEGWENDWVDSMDGYIGESSLIVQISSMGIRLESSFYRFPPSSLEKVDEL